jgi:hypothetical protein
VSAAALAPAPEPVPVARKKAKSSFLFVLALIFGAFFAAFMVVAGNGKFVMAFAAPAALLLLVALWKLPMKISVLGLLFLMWTADYLPESPQSNMWASPLYPIGQFLFLNLSALTGISALRVPGLDFTVVVLIGIALIRRATRSKIDEKSPSVRTLSVLLVLQLLTVVLLDIWGVNTEVPVVNPDGMVVALPRQGDFNESLWQLRQLLLMPMFTFLMLYAFPCKPGDLRQIARVAITAACVKSCVGLFFLYYFVRGSGFPVEYTTSHSDTLLFVPLLAMQFAWMFEKKTKQTYRDLLKWVPLMTWGMLANDRRIAYVSLGGCMLTIVLMQPWSSAKRTLLRNLMIASPAILLYIIAGWNAPPDSKVFFGSQLVKSIIKGDQAQAGADYRDIENFDVLYTWSENAIIPLGFGHKFEEPVKLPDISVAMPTYQYHPHNNILWMWTIGGLFGFFGMFAPLICAVYLAARTFRAATAPIDRVAALTVISMVIAHLNQCFGDMGTRNYFGSMGCALAMTVASKLAVRTGAWPSQPGKTIDLREPAPASVPASVPA